MVEKPLGMWSHGRPKNMCGVKNLREIGVQGGGTGSASCPVAGVDKRCSTFRNWLVDLI